MGLDDKKLDANELDKVAGGQIIEGSNGEFYVVPDNIPSFETRKDAEAVEKAFFKKPEGRHHNGFPHGGFFHTHGNMKNGPHNPGKHFNFHKGEPGKAPHENDIPDAPKK